jgi:nucleoid-associated protein YgaU
MRDSRARELAGVEPAFTTYEGEDPAGYALAVNIARRHLSKGQLAMVAARARSVSDRSAREVAQLAGTSLVSCICLYGPLTLSPGSELCKGN